MTPYTLLKDMSDINYGMYDATNKKFIYPDDEKLWNWRYMQKHCVVQSPKELEKRKVGTCYDTSWYIYTKLKEVMKMKTVEFLYFKTNKETHTTNIYKHPTSQLWYWIEYSWYINRGIHGGYKNREYIIDFIVKAFTFNKQKVQYSNVINITPILKKSIVSIPEWETLMRQGEK